MARLVGVIVSDDERFKGAAAAMLRSGPVPVSIAEDRGARDGFAPDVIVVDAVRDLVAAVSAIERLRAGAPAASIIAVASEAQPELILQSMRAGANEFLTWPIPEEPFEAAIRRIAARRAAAAPSQAMTLAFLGAKGGAGTTTVAVNCGVE
ncbi:MAG TPA: hypothetical protein VNI78_09920, partial [Vicinamibacterales bacterium]|nr:hypothetical protein [Vicinamibacterales bacterium]